jgi:uncharacterized membrane protein
MKQKTNVGEMTKMALLTAVILVMAFTPLGYLKTAGIEITFIMIPVAIGAITSGPKAGAFLGGVFGVTSFIQCFGMSQFGMLLLGVSPVRTFLLCMIPRILMGFLAGWIFIGLSKVDKKGTYSYAVSSLSCAVINTVLFVGGVGLLFRDTMLAQAQEAGISLLSLLMTFVTINSIIEMIACLVVGAVISRVIDRAFGKKARRVQETE